MKVVLQKDVRHLGLIGDVVEVKPGYAQNKLLPEGLAVFATTATLKRAEGIRAARMRSHEEMAAQAGEIAKELKGITLSFVEKVASGTHLYGSITEADIAAALKKEAKLVVEKGKIEMAGGHIKELGSHRVKVHLPGGSTAEVKVEVTEKAEKKAAAKGKTAKAKKK